MKKENGISRRTLLQNIGAVAAAGTMASPSETLAEPRGTTPDSGQTSKPLRTIALIGDRAHNSDAIRVSLDRLFKELDLPIDYTTNYYDLSASLLQPYQLFVCLRDNYIFPGGNAGANRGSQRGAANATGDPFASAGYWITEEQGKAVQDFVAAGNGFYSLHNNAFVSRSSKNYREVQGGVALNHPRLRPFKVRIVNKEHPVTQGVEDFMVTDEQHFLIYDKDPKNILLHSENIDGLTFQATMLDPIEGGPGASGPPRNLGTTSVSGWAHEYGKGRVVFTAMGHTIHAMWQPEHLKMQKNAVRWLLKMT
jgi:type 1 glutamine amidotransferase